MNLLSDLTPAETLLVLHGRKTPLKDLLKATFLDLVYKHVLEVVEETDPLLPEPLRYVVPAQNYQGYQPRPHELPFLIPFQMIPRLRALLRNVVKVAYEETQTRKAYQASIRQSPSLDGVFRQDFLQWLLGGGLLTSHGKTLRQQLRELVADLQVFLPEILVQDPEKGKEVLRVIGGNIFVLASLDLSFLKELDKQLLEGMPQPYRQWVGADDSGGGLWGYFDMCSESFGDSGGGDGGGDGGSGCGGGGCGGCGCSG